MSARAGTRRRDGIARGAAHVGGRPLDVQRQCVRAAERQQVVDHHGQARDLVLDRLQLRRARPRRSPRRRTDAYAPMTASGLRRSWLTWETYSPRSRSRSRRPFASCSSDPATRPTSLRPATSATSRSPSPIRRAASLDRLELLAMPASRALEQPHADEHEHEPDGGEPLGLDQQQIALDVLRRATDGEHASRPTRASATVPSPAAPAGARRRDQRCVATRRARLRSRRGASRAPGNATRCERRATRPRACRRGSPGPRARRGRGCAPPRAVRSPPARARRRRRQRSRGGLRAAGAGRG